MAEKVKSAATGASAGLAIGGPAGAAVGGIIGFLFGGSGDEDKEELYQSRKIFKEDAQTFAASQTADFASANVSINTGTPVDIRAETLRIGSDRARRAYADFYKKRQAVKADAYGSVVDFFGELGQKTFKKETPKLNA